MQRAGALVRTLRAPRARQEGEVALGVAVLGTWVDGREREHPGAFGTSKCGASAMGEEQPLVQAGCAARASVGVCRLCWGGGDSRMVTASALWRWHRGERGLGDREGQGHTHGLCVRGRGCRGCSWSFPRGKVAQGRVQLLCQGGGSGDCAAWAVGGGTGGAQPQGEGHRAVHRLCWVEGGSGVDTVTEGGQPWPGDSSVGSVCKETVALTVPNTPGRPSALSCLAVPGPTSAGDPILSPLKAPPACAPCPGLPCGAG